MSVAASRPPAPVVAPAPVPAPTPADREPGAAPFAELLRQSRGVERRPHAEALAAGGQGSGIRSESAASSSASESAAATSPNTNVGDESPPVPEGSARTEAGRARARSSGSTARPAAARSASPADAAERANVRTAEPSAPREENVASTDASGAAVATPSHSPRPELRPDVDADFRFGGAARRVAADPARGANDESKLSLNGMASDAGKPEVAGQAQRAGAEASGRTDAGRSAARAARDADGQAVSTSFAQIFSEAKSGDRAAAPVAGSVDPAPLTASPTATSEPSSPTSAEGAPAPQTASVAVPLDSPDFPAAFGVQVSVLVKEGVQQAELHLNPAETGPVSIAITLEGTQAHVEFGADLAATRQAIENGLPALASALRDAGFTLAGGGVAQHSRSGAGRDEQDSRRDGRGGSQRSAAIESTAAPAQRSSHRIAAGAIDLYA